MIITMKKTIAILLTLVTAMLPAAVFLSACSNADPARGNTASPENTVPPAVTPDPADTAVLSGKTALFCGDSICMASTYDTEHQWWGWAGRISRDYGLASYTNAGVDGASVSTCRGDNTVLNQLRANRNTPYDMVVLHGGVNDAWDSAPVGKMVDRPASETTYKDLDQKTFAGGLELLFIRAKDFFPEATLMYVINFKLNSHTGSMWDMTEYWAEAKKICAKYDIPFLDLYDNDEFQKVFKSYEPDNLADGIHPNSSGYDVLSGFIARFMAKVCAEN